MVSTIQSSRKTKSNSKPNPMFLMTEKIMSVFPLQCFFFLRISEFKQDTSPRAGEALLPRLTSLSPVAQGKLDPAFWTKLSGRTCSVQ